MCVSVGDVSDVFRVCVMYIICIALIMRDNCEIFMGYDGGCLGGFVCGFFFSFFRRKVEFCLKCYSLYF